MSVQGFFVKKRPPHPSELDGAEAGIGGRLRWGLGAASDLSPTVNDFVKITIKGSVNSYNIFVSA